MSVRCITKVLDSSRHAGTELLMLVVLADYSDDEGNSYPAVASLARKCRMSPRNGNYILSALQASGELRVLKNEGPRGTNRYRIMLDSLGPPMQPASPLKRAAPLKASSPLKPASPTPEAGFPKPLKPASDEPSLNRQRTVKRELDALFKTFYDGYPRKAGRADAERAFAKCQPTAELVATMLQAIEAQGLRSKCAAGEKQFVPHPATWLNGKRWLDEGTSTSSGSAWTGAL
jgi:hypothetical protein